MSRGFATAKLDDVPSSPPEFDLTSILGCDATSVTGYRLASGDSVSCTNDHESLVVPLTRGGELQIAGAEPCPYGDIAMVPVGTASDVSCVTATAVIVVSAPPQSAASAASNVVELAECTFVLPETSDIATAWLTDQLGVTGMKVNARMLHPGQHVPYHTEGTQEELFVPIAGPAAMRIDDEKFETPPGTVVRVAPEIPRSALNPGDEDALWIMIGAPPTGDSTGWDPGAKILE